MTVADARATLLTAALAATTMLAGCAGLPMPSLLRAGDPPAAAMTQDKQATLYLDVVGGLISQGRSGAALAFLDSYSGKRQELPPRYWLLRGNALQALGRYSDALDAFARLDKTALAGMGWNGCGRVASAQRQWSIAAANFERAAAIDPANADFLNNLGYARMQMGRAAAAAAALRQAHELDPASSLIRNNLIAALTLSDDRRGADALLHTIEEGPIRDKAAASVQAAIAGLHPGKEVRS